MGRLVPVACFAARADAASRHAHTAPADANARVADANARAAHADGSRGLGYANGASAYRDAILANIDGASCVTYCDLRFA